MALQRGTRLGPYEIGSPLGAGGMGEVYAARDSRLDRKVAIKVLPEQLAGNTEHRQRFEREARAASSLNHPHICTIHDVGHQDGVHYLVMEHLEGETLAERLGRGPLPVEQAVRLGVQIADALDKAHRQGLVHRDLKPGNIMLTKAGAKLLDFGLAKSTEVLATSSLTAAPTATSPLTAQGTILGTLHYMAPEQLEGKEADPRTDLFGLGAVLYEAITGRRPFLGGTQATLIASIMSSDPPPITAAQPMASPVLDRLVRTCLAKDPADRWQTAHDLMLQLRTIAEGGTQLGVPAPVVSRRRSRERWAWALAAVALLVAAALAWAQLARPASGLTVLKTSIVPPGERQFLFGGPNVGALTLSPDGRSMTFSAQSADGIQRLWLRPLDSLEARPIPGTENGQYPFWSPDSRFIAFFAGAKLRTIPAAGGQIVTVCDAPAARGGTWGADGVILFTPHWRKQPIHRVDAGGGEPVPVTELDESRNETTHRWPRFLPDGRHFLFLAGSHDQDPTSADNAVYLGAVGSPEQKLLLRARSNVIYADGHLLFMRGNSLVAQRFDLDGLVLSGEPRVVVQGVHYETGFFQGAFAASETGLLVYQEGGLKTLRKLVWVDRDGRVTGEEDFEPADYGDIFLSPDEKTIATSIGDPDDVWLLDRERRLKKRFTVHAHAAPSAWSPDGTRLVYNAEGDAFSSAWIGPVDGSRAPDRLLDLDDSYYVLDWSLDGRVVIFERVDGTESSDLWVLPMDPVGKPSVFLSTEHDEWQAQISPDGRWVALVSDRSGRDQLYVTTFPEPSGLIQVSDSGAAVPLWRGDSRELFYLAAGGRMMAVPIGPGPGPEPVIGKPRELFDADPFTGAFIPYDITADGQRFLINRLIEEPGARVIRLVTNWSAGLP